MEEAQHCLAVLQAPQGQVPSCVFISSSLGDDIQAGLDVIGRQGIAVKTEDVARPSPLLHEHVNMLGRYELSLSDEVAQGQLRPLRGLEALDDFLGQLP